MDHMGESEWSQSSQSMLLVTGSSLCLLTALTCFVIVKQVRDVKNSGLKTQQFQNIK
jgi:hypothetical protein